MNISTFARRVGISPSGVRWYESAGILPPASRRPNGYREYTDDDCSRLRMILALRRLGLTPSEAGELAERCLEGGVANPALVETLERQRRRIAQQREELERLEVELVDLETSIEATDAARRRGARPAREPIGVLSSATATQVGARSPRRSSGATAATTSTPSRAGHARRWCIR